LYVPLVYFLPELFAAEEVLKQKWFLLAAVVIGIGYWIVYDLAYAICKKMIFQRIKF
jgi:hypothetical protein